MRKKNLFIVLTIMITLFATSVWALKLFAGDTTASNMIDNITHSTKPDSDEKYIALTFDDGPHPQLTPSVLDTLAEFNIPATFYMLGDNVSKHPDLAKAVADAGHEVGNHSASHTDMTKIELKETKKEIEQTNDAIIEATGKQPETIRPPYGAYNDEMLNVFQGMNMPSILWSVDSYDWKGDAKTVKKEVLKQVHDGAIVLMHDIQSATAEALPDLLVALKEKGYKFVTVSELLSLETGADVGPYYMKKS
ncbi:polysaccharide deacetylase family protein [Bacillus sp. FSL W7-1360]